MKSKSTIDALLGTECRAKGIGPCGGPLTVDHKFNDAIFETSKDGYLKCAIRRPERFQRLCVKHNIGKHKLPWLTWMVEDVSRLGRRLGGEESEAP